MLTILTCDVNLLLAINVLNCGSRFIAIVDNFGKLLSMWPQLWW